MPVTIASDLLLEQAGNRLKLRGEANQLVAEFDSLSALRRVKRSLPSLGGRLPESLRLPGLDQVSISVRVRGRDIALAKTTNHALSVRLRWGALLATLLHLPGRV